MSGIEPGVGRPADEFRQRARAWLLANAAHGPTGGPDTVRPAGIVEQKEFQARLHAAGFAGITWPAEYGGQGLTNAEQLAFNEEAREFSLPNNAFMIGLGMPGPTILQCGTAAQKRRYLPKLLSGAEIWCQLFSEPDAGSDLAALRTTAARDGTEWVLTGQKVWTSGAHYSDFGTVLARTDRTAPKHRGITMFIVDMHAPGVTVRPLRVATGRAPFNEVFFDQVRLPETAVIGAVDQGWPVAVAMLRNERITVGTSAQSRPNPLAFDSLRRLATETGRDAEPELGQRLAELYARERAVSLFNRLLREESAAGKPPGPRGSVAKLASAQLSRFAAEVAADVLGDTVAGHPGNDRVRAVLTAVIEAPGLSIAGGTNEIQRNIIGERMLGLPKDPGVDRDTPFDQLRAGTRGRGNDVAAVAHRD